MRILAIDPGYERLGIAILEKEECQKELVLFSDCFQTSPKDTHSERLLKIGEYLETVIEKYSPKLLAIETLFFNTNQKTATKVSEARGLMLYCASRKGLMVFEYSPPQIKVAVTGYGRSDKKAVTMMVKNLIVIEKEIKFDDEYDAIAVGLTHFAINPH